MCFLTAPPPLCLIGHSQPGAAVTQIYSMGTEDGSDVTLALTVSRPIIVPEDIYMMVHNREENPRTQVLSKQLAVSPSSSLQRENRHFVNPAALNAADTEACPGLCNHSLFCQQWGNKLTRLQIRLFSKNDQQT